MTKIYYAFLGCTLISFIVGLLVGRWTWREKVRGVGSVPILYKDIAAKVPMKGKLK